MLCVQKLFHYCFVGASGQFAVHNFSRLLLREFCLPKVKPPAARICQDCHHDYKTDHDGVPHSPLRHFDLLT